MADLNIIEILISAKDQASAVIEGAALKTKAASAETNAALNGTSKEAGGLAGALGITPGGLALAAGLAATAMGVVAVKAAGDFQQQLTKLVTSAGESQQNLNLVGEGIKKLAVETGESTTQLADGMYKVSSAGFHGAEGLLVLKAAEQGAKAEGAGLETVADAVSSALIDYHLKASDAADVTSKLVAATAAGKMRFEELASAMPAILPVASAAHVSLNDILGDMASMTVHGMSAQQSAENLADTIRHMVNPTAQQAKELAMLGMTTTQLADDLKTHGLSGTLQEISSKIAALMAPGSDKVILDLKTALSGLPDQVKQLGVHLFDGSMSMKDYSKAAAELDPVAAKQALSFATLAGVTHRIGDQQMTGAQVMQNYTQALAKATGDATGLNVALMLTGENADYTNSAIKSVASATSEAGGNVKGWAEIQENFNTKWSRFIQLADTGAISLGQVLLPAASGALDLFFKMNDAVAKIPDLAGPAVEFLKSTWHDAVQVGGNVVDWLKDRIKDANNALEGFQGWIEKNKTAITVISSILGTVFGPAIILAGVRGLVAGAQWAAGAAKGGASWVLETARAGIASFIESAKIVGHGIAMGVAWAAGAVKASAVWIFEMAKTSAAIALTAAKGALHAADLGWAWVFNATRVSFVWVTQEMPKLIVSFARTAAAAAIHGAATSLAWVRNAAIAAYAWVTTELPRVVMAFITTSSASVIQAGIAGKAWVVNASQAAIAWVVTELPKIIQSFIAVAGAAIIQAAIASKAWIASAAESSAAFTAFSALVAVPLVMPAIAIGAALAAIALVWAKYNEMKAAVDGAAKAVQDDAALTNAFYQHENAVINDPNASADAKARARQAIRNVAKNAPGPAYALGTNFAAGGLTLVGENGPELVNMPTGSKVYNAKETAQMASQSNGSGVTINGGLHIHNNMDEQRFLAQMGMRLALR